MGSMDYIDIPLGEFVELESGRIYRTDPSSPESSGGGGRSTKKLPQTRSFTRITASKSKREAPMKRSPFPIKRMASNAEMGLKSLRFLDKNNGQEGGGWKAVEKRFQQFSVAGILHKENFGRCIGMAESKEFAVELFEALARRRGMAAENSITKEDLKEFWEEMTDQNFDSRLRIFWSVYLRFCTEEIIASAITIGVLLHTICHVTCDFPRLVSCPKQKFMRTLGDDFKFKQPTYPDLLASTPGWTGILMIILMSFSFTLATHYFRRNVVKLPSLFHYLAGFNAFWYAHHLLVIVYVLLIIHSYFIFLTQEWYKKTTWMYIVVPRLMRFGLRFAMVRPF